jgi:hypothetical protein
VTNNLAGSSVHERAVRKEKDNYGSRLHNVWVPDDAITELNLALISLGVSFDGVTNAIS